MNKAELIEAVQQALGGETSKRAAGEAVEAVLGAIAKALEKNKKSQESAKVQIVGFGTFKVVERAARTGVNPKTHLPQKFKASKTIRFIASAALKKSL